MEFNEKEWASALEGAIAEGSGKAAANEAAAKTSDELAEAAIDKFEQILQRKITQSIFLGETAKSALADTGKSVFKHDVGSASAELWFDGSLFRPSLTGSGGIDNIAVLLNNGYKKTRAVVRGKWHGKKIQGKRQREGARFVNEAVEDFMFLYAKDYAVVSIWETATAGKWHFGLN